LNVAVVEDSDAAGHLPAGTSWRWGTQGPWMWVDPNNGRIVLGMLQNTDYRQSRVDHRTASSIQFSERCGAQAGPTQSASVRSLCTTPASNRGRSSPTVHQLAAEPT